MSKFVFDEGKARHAVVSRDDDFADALAGSTLGFGVGPILFTPRTGKLDGSTANELARVLPPGGRVYILGGTSALPATLEQDIQALNLTPVRIAGSTRMATAAAVASEVVSRSVELGFQPPTRAVLATAYQWPDAVTAGSLGAWFGYPILLTDPTSLSAETRDALAKLRPAELLVVGGTQAVSSPVATAARDAGGSTSAVRLAGNDRMETAAAVAREMVNEFRVQSGGFDPQNPVAVNLRRTDGFAHVLSASSIIGRGSGVFLPVDGDSGDTIPASTKTLACSLNVGFGVVAGEKDLITESTRSRLQDMLEHAKGAC